MSQPIRNSQTRKKGDALCVSLEQMKQALASDLTGREGQWAASVADALARVESALRQQQKAAHEPDGLLAQVDETRPTLARQADSLRSDYGEFLTRIHALRQEMQRVVNSFPPKGRRASQSSVGEDNDLDAIREQAEQFLAGLQEHKGAEFQLVLESVNTDIGVGD